MHGFLLVGGEKMSKTRLNQIAPADLVADFGVDGFRYHFLRDTPFGPDGDFSYERMVDRYNADLANNFGNLLSRVATVVAKKCGGVGPAPARRQPARAGRRRRPTRPRPRRGTRCSRRSPSTPPGGSSARRTRLLEATEPWKLDPGPEVDAVLGDALEALRIVRASWPARPSPTAAAEAWRRIGLPGSPLDQRLPGAAAWGGYPGGLTVTKGAPLFPRLAARP